MTSYNPLAKDVTLEETGANTETDKQFIYNTYTELLKEVDAKPGMTKTETYEDSAKALFTKEPANMKLLVVVDKLLTGFDAPPCSYLYIDKSMQATACSKPSAASTAWTARTRTLATSWTTRISSRRSRTPLPSTPQNSITARLGLTPEVLLQDRLKKGKERLDSALETLALLCESVEPPKGELEHIHYFCGNTEVPRPAGTGAAAGRALQGNRGPRAHLRQHRRRTGTRRI